MKARSVKVRFYCLERDGPEAVGTLILRDGIITPEPPNSIALNKILAKPLGVYQEDGPLKLIDHKAEPEAFLKALPSVYRGTYFWAEPVEADSQGPSTRSSHKEG